MSIRLSPKHGLNPSLSVCYLCGEDKNELIIPGLLRGDAEAPRKAIWNREPCDQCKNYMASGIIFIGVTGPEVKENPFSNRTGRFCVIREEAVRRMINSKELLNDIILKRVAFVPQDVWSMLQLP